MKAASFPFPILVLAMSYAALMPATIYADETQQTSESSTTENSLNTASDRSHDEHPHDAGRPAGADDGSQKKGTASDKQPSRHAGAKNHPPSRSSLTTASHPKQLPSGGKRSIPRNTLNLAHKGSGKSNGAPKAGSVHNETVTNALPVRGTSVGRPTVVSLSPSLNNARHRGPNSAVLGGSASLRDKSAGEINGTHMNHRP
jgi:hypothetical protein